DTSCTRSAPVYCRAPQMLMIRIFPSTVLCLTLAVLSGGCRKGSAESSAGDVALAGGGASSARAVAADSALAAAERALQSGHAWQATRLLAPVLRDPGRRTPP